MDDLHEAIMRDGAVIIEGLFDEGTIEGLKADIGPVLEHSHNGSGFGGNRTRRASGLFRYSKHMVTVAQNPLYRGVCDKILNAPVDIQFGGDSTPIPSSMHIGATQAVMIGPGQAAQPLHRDDLVFLWRHPNEREATIQIMVAATDFTAETGGTNVIPGSHLWDDNRVPTREEAIPTEMKAGSALIFIGSAYHGGGENSTEDEFRMGVSMSYDLGILRAQENPFLLYNLETIRSFPEQLQKDLDWHSEHYLGWVEVEGELLNPIELLADESWVSIDDGLPKHAPKRTASHAF
ncbi:MAG: phytanoyl-CoA dioxygenase family protein [Rhodococcus sp. (in: high G+C Gram-positive bacteria)]